MRIRLFSHKEWFEICVIFFRDGVEELTGNASCFVISFHVNNKLQFSKDVSKSTSLFVHKSLPNVSIKISYYAYECTQNG